MPSDSPLVWLKNVNKKIIKQNSCKYSDSNNFIPMDTQINNSSSSSNLVSRAYDPSYNK